jgi:uncharacterized protein (TIGR03492 family)
MVGLIIRKADPGVDLLALPIVGLGKSYDQAGIANLGERLEMPSGGFAKEGLKYLLKDVKAGLIGMTLRQIKTLRREGRKADLVVCIGDVLTVTLAGLFARRPILFVDSQIDYWPDHSSLEKWTIRRFCKTMLIEDRRKIEVLRKSGLPVSYVGSWVMDSITGLTGKPFAVTKGRRVVGLLPGTRGEAYGNFLMILDVVDAMKKLAPDGENLIGLAASVLELGRLKSMALERGWTFSQAGDIEVGDGIAGKLESPTGAEVFLAEGRFGDVCLSSDVVIGLAGIANEQAAGLGVPVVAFVGRGPQTTMRRWREVEPAAGGAMLVLTGELKEKARRIWSILRDASYREKLSRLGKESKGERGAVERIATAVIEELRR